MKEIIDCPVCGNTEFTKHVECQDHLTSKEKFVLKKCKSCELIITTPIPSQLAKYYQSPEYISHTDSGTNLINQIYLTARKYTLQQKRRLIEEYSAKGTLLDIGCGTGNFLKVCQEKNWSVQGVEPSEHARSIAKKSLSNIEEKITDVTDKNINAITLWHVLEHIPDINNTIQQIKSLLNQNGTIFIAVPNYESYDSTVYKKHWAAYDVPRHLWHFNQKSMTYLTAKHSLRIIKTIPMKLDGFYVSLLSERYMNNGMLNIKGATRAFFNGIKSNAAARKNNNYSSLIYIIKK